MDVFGVVHDLLVIVLCRQTYARSIRSDPADAEFVGDFCFESACDLDARVGVAVDVNDGNAVGSAGGVVA